MMRTSGTARRLNSRTCAAIHKRRLPEMSPMPRPTQAIPYALLSGLVHRKQDGWHGPDTVSVTVDDGAETFLREL